MSFPILYEAKETDFSHLGLGALRDATECLVAEERNGIFELKMQYPIDGAGFEEIKNDRLIKADASNDLKDQRFKIIRITKPAKGLVTIYAEHISYLTQDLPLEPVVTYVGGASGALNLWKNSTVVDNPFITYTDITTEGSINWTIDKVANSRRALGGVSGSMLDVFGGEYMFDNYNISLFKSRGMDKGALIAYGKNLIDLEQDEQIANTYTSVYPYSRYVDDSGVEHTVTLPERYIDSDQVDNYARRKILTIDFTAEEITTVSALRARAERYIIDNNVGVPRVSLQVKFIDLAKTLDYKHLKLIEEINLCDTVTVHFEKLGIKQKAKVVKTTWNVLLDRYEELEIGESRATLTSAISAEIKEQEESTIVVFDNLRKQIINSYWNSDGYNYDLRAGNEYSLPGGYYSFDKPIDQNPTKAIYMGAGTLLIANSKNPNGSWNWRTVATGDGLVADTIATGMLKSINGNSYFDLTNNKIKTNNAEITGGIIDINTDSGISSNIKLNYGDYSHEISPARIRIFRDGDLAFQVETQLGTPILALRHPTNSSLNIQLANGQVTSNTVYATGNMYALAFVDHTPHYEGNALEELSKVRGDGEGGINHATLPGFTQVKIENKEDSQSKNKKGNQVDGRDLGAMVSVLTKAIQELIEKNNEQDEKINKILGGAKVEKEIKNIIDCDNNTDTGIQQSRK